MQCLDDRRDSGLYTCHGDNQWKYIANDTVRLEVSKILKYFLQENRNKSFEGFKNIMMLGKHLIHVFIVCWIVNLMSGFRFSF